MSDASTEQWHPVIGYEGLYEVSDQGRVRSLKIPGRRGSDGRVLRGGLDSAGYLSVALSMAGKVRTHRIHRLVASSFLEPHPGFVVNHISGNKIDNRLTNLEWVTQGENQLHAYRVLGRAASCQGKPSPRRKFSQDQVTAIRRDPRAHRVIAADHGVCRSTISHIKQGYGYKESA